MVFSFLVSAAQGSVALERTRAFLRGQESDKESRWELPATSFLSLTKSLGRFSKLVRCLIDLLKWYMENSEDNIGQQKLSGINYCGDSNISPTCKCWNLYSINFVLWVGTLLEHGSDAFLFLKWSASSCWFGCFPGQRAVEPHLVPVDAGWAGGASMAAPTALSPAETVEADWAPFLSLAGCPWGDSSSERPPSTSFASSIHTGKRFSKRFVFVIEAVRCPFLFPDTLTCRHRV